MPELNLLPPPGSSTTFRTEILGGDVEGVKRGIALLRASLIEIAVRAKSCRDSLVPQGDTTNRLQNAAGLP
jgi:hypothetical protein